MNNNIAELKKKLILTFGYGNRKNHDKFLEYLKKYQVDFVIDVRMTPRAWSRKWYGNKLQEVCEAHDVKYISKTALGNISGQKNWVPPDLEEADIALREVAELAEKGTVLLLCAEMNFHRCHRTDVASHLIQLISNSQIEHLE
ncbi:MAG: DUF488 family protein [Planktothrix sp.]|uniref:DUF488 family protein n=1 Tax=Planktothrix sp. TaxID=3088171 RepID=UPI0038D44950